MPTRRNFVIGTMAGAASLLLKPRPAHASIEGIVVKGENGWLYSAWETVPPVNLTLIDRVTPIIAAVVNQFKAAGIDIIIPLIPIRARVMSANYPAKPPFARNVQQRYAYGHTQLTQSGLLVPDIATLMADLTQQSAAQSLTVADEAGFLPVGTDLYFKADTHWTTNASLPVADEIARHILANFQLPQASAPGTQFGPPGKMLQEQNDLAELLATGERSQYPMQSYMLPQAAENDQATALTATDAADTILIGNSYMQPKYGFASQLSNKLNRPVGLFWKIDRYGPFRTLLDYLQSSLFQQQRPKLIIWNLRETHLEHLPDDADFYAQSAVSPADLTAAIKAALA